MTGSPRAKRVRQAVLLAAKVIIIGGIFAYLLVLMLSQWGEVRKKVVEVNVVYIVAAVFFHVFSMVFLALLWRELLGTLGEKLSFVSATRMQWLAALGKYVPGRVSTTLGKVYLGGVDGADRTSVGLGCVYEILFCSAGSALVVLMSIIYGSLHHIRVFTAPAAVLVVVLLVCIHPRIVLPPVNWLLRRSGREPVARALPYRQSLLFSFGYMLPYVLGGASEFALLRAFYDVPSRHMIDVMGISAFSVSVGFAALFAPGGLGVRDGLVAKGLTWLKVPASGAVLVALAGRLLVLALDFASGVVAVAMYGKLPWRLRRDRAA